MWHVLNVILWGTAIAVAAPILVFCVECVAALFVRRTRSTTALHDEHAPAPRVAVLIPAHNEEQVLERTLRGVLPTLPTGGRVVVVADNCSDRTAHIACELGADAVERTDTVRRGKGYALDFGVRSMESNPPDVVVVLDADCDVDPRMVETLARRAHVSGRPVQSLNLGKLDPGIRGVYVVSSLGNRFINLIRPLGLAKLGLPCRLMGTGMAIPWPQIQTAELAAGNIVEDTRLGIDLAIAGHTTLFCPEVGVTSRLPQQASTFTSQRTRWEHGHLQTVLEQVPRLLTAAWKQRRVDLLGLAADLFVPPLSLLCAIWFVALAATSIAALYGASWWPAAIISGAGALLALSIAAGWIVYCRKQIPLSALAAIPGYVLRKLPIYAKFLVRRQKDWVRTAREVSPTTDAASVDVSAAKSTDRILTLLGVRITDVTVQRAVDIIESIVLRREQRTRSVYFVNAHTLNLASTDPNFRDVLNHGDYVFGDGTGVRWGARLQGIRVRDNLVGTDLVPSLFQLTAGKGYSYYLFGSDETTVAKAAAYAKEHFPGWTLAGTHHGFVKDPAVNQAAIDQINAARPDVLLVGMGNPLQERWIQKHAAQLNVPICLGIGGLYDYWAGNVSRAPAWVRRIGYEWLWRLGQQPRDKAKRYLIGNPVYLWRIAGEYVRLHAPAPIPLFGRLLAEE